MEEIFSKIPGCDLKNVMGDFNAQVGKEQIYKHLVGKHTEHQETNDNGKKCIAFATRHGLLMARTLFEHKRIHTVTLISPKIN